MKRNRKMIVVFLTPAAICYILIFLYPTIRTFFMSFFSVDQITSGISTWQFAGLSNYKTLLDSSLFIGSLWNIVKMWLFGGIGIFFIAMLFAVILSSGIKGKGLYRSLIYMPNVISAVAMGTMWIQYVYSAKFGLLKSFFTCIGAQNLANMQWTAPEMMFVSLLIAYSFGMIGYFMIIFMAGIERIPDNINEAAKIDGADGIRRFFKITLPLLKDVIRTTLVLWTIEIVGFFVWSQVFSPRTPDKGTITPMVYMYQLLFGSENVVTERNIGSGAAVGVLLTLIVISMFIVCTRLLKDDKLEY